MNTQKQDQFVYADQKHEPAEGHCCSGLQLTTERPGSH
jgi:hypothetical protein